MSVDIAKPCEHIRGMDRYYPSKLGKLKWHIVDGTTSVSVYDDAPDGKDKPLTFDDYDDALDASDHLNDQNES